MTLVLVIAADLLCGLYLLVYGIRRERRDKPAVLIVGGVLLACALALTLIGAYSRTRPPHPPPSTPPPAGTPV
jgi:drug/metabolite transporter (DMT)-like permease